MASPPMATVNFDAELLGELSGLDDQAFNRVLQSALDNVYQANTDAQFVEVPLTVSSSSRISVSDV